MGARAITTSWPVKIALTSQQKGLEERQPLDSVPLTCYT
jgi:hypothetical protein